MSVEFDRESPGKFDSRTLSRKTLSRRTGRILAAATRGRRLTLIMMIIITMMIIVILILTIIVTSIVVQIIAITIMIIIHIIIIIIIIITILHPVSITRFPLRRFSPGAGLLRNILFIGSGYG